MNFWIVLLLVIVAYFLGRRHGEKATIERVEQILIRNKIELETIDKSMEKAEKN